VLIDRSQIVVGRRKHVEIAYPEHFAFNADQTAIRLVARYDIQAITPGALVKIIGVTASPHPVAVRPPHLPFEAGAGGSAPEIDACQSASIDLGSNRTWSQTGQESD
jgi:hypothetical protein